jgi:serine/threonine-protein kinase SRPK3
MSSDREFCEPGFETEDIELYSDGGFHPLRLGSFFRGRYHIKGKLGFGGCGIVWWAKDIVHQRHVAVKIITAHASKKFDKLRSFYYHAGEDRAPYHPGRSHIV